MTASGSSAHTAPRSTRSSCRNRVTIAPPCPSQRSLFKRRKFLRDGQDRGGSPSPSVPNRPHSPDHDVHGRETRPAAATGIEARLGVSVLAGHRSQSLLAQFAHGRDCASPSDRLEISEPGRKGVDVSQRPGSDTRGGFQEDIAREEEKIPCLVYQTGQSAGLERGPQQSQSVVSVDRIE